MNLPQPTVEAIAHSAKVTDMVRQYIKQADGMLPFETYMNLVLYEPELGYYVTGTQKFNEFGDFTTAPELGSIFGRCLARQAAEVLRKLGGGSILEVGPGTGALASAMLEELETLDVMPEQYAFLEISPELKDRQQQYLSNRSGHHFSRYKWLETLPTDWTGLVLANEVVDAFPVSLFRAKPQHATVAYVYDKGGVLGLCWSDKARSARGDSIVEIHDLPEGYISEYSDRAQAWAATISSMLSSGLMLIIDYGYSAREYYHPDRINGTLMCHYQHRAHTNPLWYPGIQDITTHVDFSAFAAAGLEAGCELAGFSTQEAFLLSLGITDFAEHLKEPYQLATTSHEIRQLILPSAMGQTFKVLGLAKRLEGPLRGFSLRDRSDTL
ncbi:MAG: SAM-dependent methyltransferase [Acidiferrobacteraceae bacterium]|nr:SAM-dependent methyltransferase [Acidiferrobacteraceae bacterium]